MKIVNPNDHPIIKQILNSPSIDDRVKKIAATTLRKIITRAYSNGLDEVNHGMVTSYQFTTLDQFMECSSLMRMFMWDTIEPKFKRSFWYEINDRIYWDNKGYEYRGGYEGMSHYKRGQRLTYDDIKRYVED